jgi:hypothetical protein
MACPSAQACSSLAANVGLAAGTVDFSEFENVRQISFEFVFSVSQCLSG